MGGPAPRGMDRYVLEVDDDGELYVVGDPVDGPPDGTDTIDQEPGPHCIQVGTDRGVDA